MAVLLLGSTGNGKSTLGNFLLDPEKEHTVNNQTFKTAPDNKPETQYAVSATRKVRMKGHGSKNLTVIDTPGLNDSAVNDLSHMIQITGQLKLFTEVKACIMVVKFSSKIDAQYKATIEYYSKLLPDLFSKNVVIVLTDYATDKRSLVLREMRGIDVQQTKRNTVKEIVECAGLEYDPMIFTIDCVPYDEEEREANIKVRDALLQHIHTLQPIEVASLKMAKTAYIKREDGKKIEMINGQIDGYSRQQQQADSASKRALLEFERKEAEVTKATETCDKLRSELKDKDSSETVVVDSWSVKEPWTYGWQSRTFRLQSQHKIEKVDEQTNGHSTWTITQKDEKNYKAKLQGHFMRGLYASLILETSKRIKFAVEIQKLQPRIEIAEGKLSKLKSELEHIYTKQRDHLEQVELLNNSIKERKEERKRLSSDDMSLEEAEERLKAMKKY